jgi:hypothetical protein
MSKQQIELNTDTKVFVPNVTVTETNVDLSCKRMATDHIPRPSIEKRRWWTGKYTFTKKHFGSCSKFKN